VQILLFNRARPDLPFEPGDQTVQSPSSFLLSVNKLLKVLLAES